MVWAVMRFRAVGPDGITQGYAAAWALIPVVLSLLPALFGFLLFPPTCPKCGSTLRKLGRPTVMWRCQRCGHFEDTGVVGG